MACNCSKGGKKPHGTEPKQSQQSIQREGAKQSFELRTSDGKTQSFARKLDADAARIRSGGTLR